MEMNATTKDDELLVPPQDKSPAREGRARFLSLTSPRFSSLPPPTYLFSPFLSLPQPNVRLLPVVEEQERTWGPLEGPPIVEEPPQGSTLAVIEEVVL